MAHNDIIDTLLRRVASLERHAYLDLAGRVARLEAERAELPPKEPCQIAIDATLECYPNAYAEDHGGHWHVFDDSTRMQIAVGYGETEAEAWMDAKRQLETEEPTDDY